jgi:outer membrane protein insertion porin family
VFENALDQLKPGESVEIDGQAYDETKLGAELDKAEDAEKAAYGKYKAARKAVRLATMTYRVVEGRQYHVGKVEFQFGEFNKGVFESSSALKPVLTPEALTSVLLLKEGEVFQPGLLRSENKNSDIEAIRLAYGRKAYNKTKVTSLRQPDPNTARIDILYQVEEGKPVYIELIKIEGNVETKDMVIRRELAVSPGEPFDMGRVKLSEERITGLRLFDEVRTEQEPVAGFEDRENLIVSLKERRTARAGFGGGFSTDYGAFGQVFYAEENFDILRWRQPHPLQGGGQKFRVRASLGSRRDNYTLDFEEPWMFGRKLRFTTSLFASEYQYYSDYYDVSEAGVRLGLERTLMGLDYLRAGINYTVESTGIYNVSDSASAEMKGDAGRDLISKFGFTLAYDTRGGGYLPTKGQRTELLVESANRAIGSDKDFYKLHFTSAQYFKGLSEGHVIEAIVRTGVVENYGDTTEVPFIERYALGGTSSLRGFDFREVGPRDAKNVVIGGKTMAVGTLEYSVPLPLGDWVRFATFYDIGFVSRSAYDYSFDDYNDDWGIGLRLDIPMLGPMRLDYAFPLTTDAYNDDGGTFNFTFGYTQAF